MGGHILFVTEGHTLIKSIGYSDCPLFILFKILKQVNAETMVTHEVSAATASNLIGQRDFLSVRHCYKQNSSIYLGGVATNIESHPPQKNFVR